MRLKSLKSIIKSLLKLYTHIKIRVIIFIFSEDDLFVVTEEIYVDAKSSELQFVHSVSPSAFRLFIAEALVMVTTQFHE